MRRRERRPLVGRDVVERAEVAGPIRIERQVLDAEDGDARPRLARLRDRTVERAAGAVGSVVADEDPPPQL